MEYKFGSSKLGQTADGLQMSDDWLVGTKTGEDRLLQSLGGDRNAANSVKDAMLAERVEKWVVHTDPFGNVTVGLVDSSGVVVKQPVSKLIGGKP